MVECHCYCDSQHDRSVNKQIEMETIPLGYQIKRNEHYGVFAISLAAMFNSPPLTENKHPLTAQPVHLESVLNWILARARLFIMFFLFVLFHNLFRNFIHSSLVLFKISIWFTDNQRLVVNLPESWWRHQMETFSALLAICARNSLVSGEVPAQRPVTRSFDGLFDLRVNIRLSKQSWGWLCETPSRPLWRHCSDTMDILSNTQDEVCRSEGERHQESRDAQRSQGQYIGKYHKYRGFH